MIQQEKCVVIDVDGVLCPNKKPGDSYSDLRPNEEIVDRLRQYQRDGFYIILYTSRNMMTYHGNMGLIAANTAKELLGWLDRHEIPYAELHLGKPWTGRGGFYVDDKAIRPDEFLRLSYEQILKITGNE